MYVRTTTKENATMAKTPTPQGNSEDSQISRCTFCGEWLYRQTRCDIHPAQT